MKPQLQVGAAPLDGVPAQKLLEGLARLYQLVLVLDGDGHIVWLSDDLGAMCASDGDPMGRDARDLFCNSQEFRREFSIRSQLRQKGVLSNLRLEMRDRRGKVVPVELNILPIRVDGDERPLHVAIARPIETSRPAWEGAGHEIRSLATVLDGAPDAVVVVDGRGFITYANPRIESLVGRSPASLVDQPIASLLSNPGEVEALVASLVPEEGVDGRELTLHSSDGGAVRVSVSASALPASGPAARGTIFFLRRMTEQAGTSETLARKNVELEHCVHSLAHDLRSPLVALLGFSRLLRQDYGEQLDETGLHFIDRIEQAGRTMEELIHDLLEFSRIGRAGERRALVDPRAVLLKIEAEMKPRLDAVHARLDLPENPPLVFCDTTRLYQVFSNLVGNAVDHMGPCDDPVISVEVWDERSSHEIAVRDRGRGIASENHERIFEVFQSLGPSSDGRRGSGIGLAIVKKIAETHGGRVWVESEPGGGATFRLSLPQR